MNLDQNMKEVSSNLLFLYFIVAIRVTRRVYEKVAQNVAQTIFLDINMYITFSVGKRSPKIWPTLVIFMRLTKANNDSIRPIGSPWLQYRGSWSQSYDHDLQRQRCKILQRQSCKILQRN
jgi:hypothetical protein